MKNDRNIVEYIKSLLNDIDCYVNGNERPNDWFDCGYVDGSWDTLIDILNQIGVEHTYKKVAV